MTNSYYLDFQDNQNRKLCQMYEVNISSLFWKKIETIYISTSRTVPFMSLSFIAGSAILCHLMPNARSLWVHLYHFELFDTPSYTVKVSHAYKRVTLLYACETLTVYMYQRCQYHSLVDFQLSVKSDSIPLPDISAKSARCHTGFHSSDNTLIINVHCSEETASQIREFIDLQGH